MVIDFTAVRIARLNCSDEAKDCLTALRTIRGEQEVIEEINLMAQWANAKPVEWDDLGEFTPKD